MDAGLNRVIAETTVASRTSTGHGQPLVATTLAIGLVLAIVTEGNVPELWTKALLAALILPTIVTALWLTGSEDAYHGEPKRPRT